MPLTFPTSPTNGQTTTLSGTTYTYNASKGVWEATASGGGFVAGAFSEHILPDTNDTYDIGSAEKKIRDLYVSDNSLHIGDHTMSADSEGINIPALKLGTGSNRVKLMANAEGKLRQIRTVGGVAQAEEGISSDAGTTAVDTFAELQAAPVVAGKTVLVRNTNKLYINTGTGWYVVGQVTNESPTAITGLDATYSLATDGTATVITMVSTDPEGFPLTWSHAVTTGTLGSTATITNVDNVFTITPSTTEADAGVFSVTFSASDGNQASTSVSAFTLSFSSEDVRLNISSTFPGPTYPNEVPANHAVSGQYLELTQTMSNNTRYGNIDFGPDNFEEVWVEIKGGNGGKSSVLSTGYSGGSGSRIRASLDLTAIHTAYGHKKINFSVGRSGGTVSAESPNNKQGSGGGASAVWVWSNSNGTSGTAIPLIVAAGGGGASNNGSGVHEMGKNAFLPSSNMTTYQLFSHFSGFDSSVTANTRPWLDEGPPNTGSGNGASWSEIGKGYGASGFARDTSSIRDQFSLTPISNNLNANVQGANSPTFGGGGAAAYAGGGGGGYYGGYSGRYDPLGAMGGQSYIDTNFITLISHINIATDPIIKIHKVNSSW